MVFVYYFYSECDSIHKIVGVFENKLEGLKMGITYIIDNQTKFLKQDVNLTELKAIADFETLDRFLCQNQKYSLYGGSPGWYLVCEEHNII